jgi:hypothetical protein
MGQQSVSPVDMIPCIYKYIHEGTIYGNGFITPAKLLEYQSVICDYNKRFNHMNASLHNVLKAIKKGKQHKTYHAVSPVFLPESFTPSVLSLSRGLSV